MESSREKEARKIKAVLAANSNQRAGEHWEDMGWGREDRDKQSPVEDYGGGPMPHEGQRGLSEPFS